MEHSSETNTTHPEAQPQANNVEGQSHTTKPHESPEAQSSDLKHSHAEHENKSEPTHTDKETGSHNKEHAHENGVEAKVKADGESADGIEKKKEPEVDSIAKKVETNEHEHGKEKKEEKEASEPTKMANGEVHEKKEEVSEIKAESKEQKGEEQSKEKSEEKVQVETIVVDSTQKEVVITETKEEIVVNSKDEKHEMVVNVEKKEETVTVVHKVEEKEGKQGKEEKLKEEIKEEKIEIKEEKAVVKEVAEEAKEGVKEVVQMSEEEADIQTLDDMVLKIVDEFANWMRLDDAYKHYQEYVALADKIKKKNNPEVNDFIDHLNKEHKRTFLDITTNYKYVEKVAVDIEDETGWTTEKSSEGYTIKYKTGGSDIASLKIEGVMDVPLENLLALIYEIELYNKWLPFMKTTTELKTINKGFKASYLRLNIPPPLSDRETLLAGFGVDRFNLNGTVLILARSVDNNKDFIKDHKIKLPPDTSNSLLAMNMACFEYKPLGRNKVRMRAVVNLDPQIRFLPNSVMSWLLRKSGSLIYEKMYKHAKNFKGSVWEERLNGGATSKDFYDWLRKRIEVEINSKEVDANWEK